MSEQEQNQNQAIATRPNMVLGLNVKDLSEAAGLIFNSKVYGDIQTKEAAAIKIVAGMEYGFNPFQSMSMIDFIQGRPTLNAHGKATLINSSGKFRLKIVELTNQNCSIDVLRLNGDKWEKVNNQSFSWQDAVTAGYTTGKNAHTYKNTPRNMLFARCVSNIWRWECSELNMMKVDPSKIQEFEDPALEEGADEQEPTKTRASQIDPAPEAAKAEEVEKDYIDAEIVETEEGDKVDKATGEVVEEAAQPAAATAEAPVEQTGPTGQVKTAVDLATKLQKDWGVDFESLSMQFLPEGVAKFSALTEEQAAEVVPGLAELLNTKVKAAKG